jgi:mono/diheme cytochrome c family protein
MPSALPAQTSPTPKAASTPEAQRVARGEYLSNFGGCNDCHTPKVMGPNGLAPDGSRLLSGHPASERLPAPPRPSGPWAVSANAGGTAWAGPWGVTYAVNLTPDRATGLGSWTSDEFREAMRTGKLHGTPILPPMPWQNVGKLTDDDLRALFAYLQSLAAVKNEVPPPPLEHTPRER